MPDHNIRRLEIQNLLKYLNDDDKCLEVRCGNGITTCFLTEIKVLDILEIDVNANMIKLAQKQDMSKIKGTITFMKKMFSTYNSKKNLILSILYDV